MGTLKEMCMWSKLLDIVIYKLYSDVYSFIEIFK